MFAFRGSFISRESCSHRELMPIPRAGAAGFKWGPNGALLSLFTFHPSFLKKRQAVRTSATWCALWVCDLCTQKLPIPRPGLLLSYCHFESLF